HLPMPVLGSLSILPEAAKLITAPDPTLSEGAWQEQVQHCVALVGRHGPVIEWALALDMVPHFLRATYGVTLEGLAYTASRVVDVCREASLPGPRVSLDVAQPVAAYRYRAAHLGTQDLSVPLHLKTPAVTGRDAALFQASIWLGTLLCDGLGD